ncbi:MAG: hypothetical protein O3C69_05600 [Chloroflexi bacterium]|nr:hypothetical protein [Chloroflexota bacterium]
MKLTARSARPRPRMNGLRDVLDVEPVSLSVWAVMLGISLTMLVAAELYKRYRKHDAPARAPDARQPA